MQPYTDRGGDTTVIGFEDGDDFIRIQYLDGAILEFRVGEVSAAHVMNLRQLAQLGEGLQSYLSRHVPTRLARRIK